jgi:hypothetical protein
MLHRPLLLKKPAAVPQAIASKMKISFQAPPFHYTLGDYAILPIAMQWRIGGGPDTGRS